MERGKEVGGLTVVASGDAAEGFEAAEAAFDAVAQFVSLLVVGNLETAGADRGDNRLHSVARDAITQRGTIIPLIGQDGLAVGSFQQSFSLGDLVDLAWRQNEA